MTAQSQIADTALAQDTVVVVAPDTASALQALTRGMGDAGSMLARGEWDLFWLRLYEGAAAMIVAFVPNLLKAIFVFVLFYALYRVLYTVLRGLLHRARHVDTNVETLALKTFRIVMITFIAIMVLAQFGINVTSLIAGLSIAGIAIGFAARDTLENFISGVVILTDRPFRVGDQVDVDGTYGTVLEISFRSTRIRTLNNVIMVMPNVQMVNQKVFNHTMLHKLRVQVPFGIAYKESPSEARAAVLKAVEGDERILQEPPPRVVVTELDDSSVNMELRFYIMDSSMELPLRFEYMERIFEALRAANIEIPFPHLQLFIDEAKAFENSYLMHPRPPSAA